MEDFYSWKINIPYESILVEDLLLEKSLYTALTLQKYRSNDDEISISSLINEVLQEYFHTYVVAKRMGHMLISRDIVKTAVEGMTDDQLRDASASNVERYKEGAIIEYGRPSLEGYLRMIRAFARANNFAIEISRNPETNNQVLIVNFHMGDKFSQLKANTYRILLDEFADIDAMQVTNNIVSFEFKPKKQLQESKT